MKGSEFERLVLKLLLTIIRLIRSEGYLKQDKRNIQQAEDFIGNDL